MTTEELIKKAKGLLEGIEPPPWAVGGIWGTEIVSPTGYIVANEVCLGDREFIAAAPDLVRELVKALEETLTRKQARIKEIQAQKITEFDESSAE